MGAWENNYKRMRELLYRAGVRRRFGSVKHCGERPVDEWPGWIHKATGRWMGLTLKDAFRSCGIKTQEEKDA